MKLLSLLCGLLFSILVFGQKNHFDLSYGVSFPLGKFQQKDLSSQGSGFAQRGARTQISYSRTIGEKLRLIANYQAIGNSMDNTNLLKEFIAQYPTIDYAAVYFRIWAIKSLHLGISRSFKLGESDFSLSPSLLIGYSYIQRPSLLIRTTYNAQNRFTGMSEDGTAAHAPSFMIELQTSYSISKKVSLVTAINYFQTEARMNFNRIPSYGNNNPYIVQEISYLQKIKTLGINGGIQFHF